MDRGARDEALKKASAELMPNFTQCPRDQRWVDSQVLRELRDAGRGTCLDFDRRAQSPEGAEL